ncbi:diaminopropionate ammonia-lyase [Paralcaligenes sp. KSB-10]|uniref:diaminopropionate ammonia-lyase n=1 Tax=Paralcaligenes sp. KSB-10 TaxID=2901142 RepID=UPI001E470A4F|nr:diaminopropionate ammonia-lyase [Paralcaligenes sp. KSB-10]UHL62897.1 diaminopropionate ammonia-lyase [Paralcaligenes sp. KSB-10]
MKLLMNTALADEQTRAYATGLPNLDSADVHATLRAVFDYTPSPLRDLPTLAKDLDIGRLWLKDEGRRLGLRSFKALGGAYTVLRLVMEEATRLDGKAMTTDELPRSASGSLAIEPRDGRPARDARAQRFYRAAATMTFVCATDGNHGQSVAAGARLAGARAVILVHGGVTQARRNAIARFGAQIVEVKGTYDDAVAESMRLAQSSGWTLLSDTTWPGYEDIPRWVMQGYTLISRELAEQLDTVPTHVFLQAGVGGFAAALARSMALQWAAHPPKFIVVEPSRAACLFESAKADHPVRVDAGEPTLMSMLECYEPSLVAWRVLRQYAAAYMTIEEEDAIQAMRALAMAKKDEEVVLAGESGAAGLAGLLALAGDRKGRGQLGLDQDSRVLLVNTESATDEARFHSLMGFTASEVSQRAGVLA